MSQVLIVDDDRALRSALRKRIEGVGYDVLEAHGGRQALEQFQRHHPSIVLLDAAMPDVSGFEVCQAIRAIDPDRHTGILVVSGMSTPSPDYVANCATLSDADGYLRKPVVMCELLAEIAALYRSRHYREQFQ